MRRFVFIQQHRRANIVDATLLANKMHEVRAAQFDLFGLAKLVEFPQVYAGHRFLPRHKAGNRLASAIIGLRDQESSQSTHCILTFR